MEEVKKNIDRSIDEFEAIMLENFEQVDCPVTHKFVPGLYIREIFMPKDTILTSLIHKTTHPFVILEGKVAVFSENDGEQYLEAGHMGITTPNTRRVLRIVEDTRWVTFHPTAIQPENDSPEAIEEAVRLIGEKIIDWRKNTILGGVIKNNVLIKNQKYVQQD